MKYFILYLLASTAVITIIEAGEPAPKTIAIIRKQVAKVKEEEACSQKLKKEEEERLKQRRQDKEEFEKEKKEWLEGTDQLVIDAISVLKELAEIYKTSSMMEISIDGYNNRLENIDNFQNWFITLRRALTNSWERRRFTNFYVSFAKTALHYAEQQSNAKETIAGLTVIAEHIERAKLIISPNIAAVIAENLSMHPPFISERIAAIKSGIRLCDALSSVNESRILQQQSNRYRLMSGVLALGALSGAFYLTLQGKDFLSEPPGGALLGATIASAGASFGCAYRAHSLQISATNEFARKIQ